MFKLRKISLYSEVIDILVNKKNELAEIPPEQKLFETPFILNYEKFVDLCFILGVRQNLFELKRNFIDIELIDKRNNVAWKEILYKTNDTKNTIKRLFRC